MIMSQSVHDTNCPDFILVIFQAPLIMLRLMMFMFVFIIAVLGEEDGGVHFFLEYSTVAPRVGGKWALYELSLTNKNNIIMKIVSRIKQQ